MKVLCFRYAAEIVSEAHETARRYGELGLLVVLVRSFDQIFHDIQASLDRAVSDGEAVLTGEFRHPLRDPPKQALHPEGDHRSHRWLRPRPPRGGRSLLSIDMPALRWRTRDAEVQRSRIQESRIKNQA